ncbi:S1 RNA-binding domain-containing protein [Laceyella putida]|uniref:S1 RNA-binding domain-containing protein n=1 Tax=Laceyella putida TaxID=110101 RepID=A0ABW2RN52_9BACL
MSIDERISQYLNKERHEQGLPYDEGEIVPVRVTKLVDYGAFVVTRDRHLVSGLIHISQIPQEIQLEVNHMLEAQVKQIKEYNKLELSLMYLAEKESPFALLKEMKSQLPEKKLPKEEIDEIIAFFSKEFGLVSEISKKKINELVKEMGVFHFTITMMKALPDFQRDLVYHFLKEVEQAGDRL